MNNAGDVLRNLITVAEQKSTATPTV